jgi:hypothetical protein
MKTPGTLDDVDHFVVFIMNMDMACRNIDIAFNIRCKIAFSPFCNKLKVYDCFGILDKKIWNINGLLLMQN